MNIREFARLAHTSPASVSKAFHHSADISEKKRDEILSLAKQYGYRHAMRTSIAAAQKGLRIGVLYVDALNRRTQLLIQRFSNRLYKNGGSIVACSTLQSVQQPCDFLDRQCQVDGILCLCPNVDYSRMPHTRAPIAGIVTQRQAALMRSGGAECDFVWVNLRTGLSQAIDELRLRGHRKLALIDDEDAILTDDFGALTAIWPNRASCLHCASGLPAEEAGFQAMQALLSERDIPSAVICAGNELAIGAAKAVELAGRHIPEAISLISCDILPAMLFTRQQLALIDCLADEQVDGALQLLLDRIQGGTDAAVRGVEIQARFAAGKTIGKSGSPATAGQTESL